MELDRSGVIDRLQSRVVSIDEFNFDHLYAPPLYSLLTQQDIDTLYNIATSVKYSGNARKKYQAIDNVMKPRGFLKLSAGTNRVVYKFLEDDTFVVKVAADAVGIKDNPKEFINQHIFKPFVTKVFEVSPCGTVATAERVIPITSREEFTSVADDVYDVINEWFIGKYIMADIGTNFFMNWGIRRGFGPVLLDFPYCYELDGNKLYCTALDNNSPTGKCEGVIDYDDGFNFLRCQKCGTRYRVRELAKSIKEETILIKGRRSKKMKVSVVRNGVNVSEAEDSLGLKPAANKIERSSTGTPVGQLKVTYSRQQKAVSGKQEKVNSNNNLRTPNNNRGIVRANGNKIAVSTSGSGNSASVKITAFTPEQIHNMDFKFGDLDNETGIMTFEEKNGMKVSTDIKSVPSDVIEVLAANNGICIIDNSEEIESLQIQLDQKNEAFKVATEDAAAAIRRYDDLQEMVQHDKEKLQEVTEKMNASMAENTGLTKKVSKQEKELFSKSEKIDELKKTIATDTETISKLKAELDKLIMTQPDSETVNSEALDKDNKIKDLEDEIIKLQSKIEDLQSYNSDETANNLAATISNLTDQLSESDDKVVSLEKEKSAWERKQENLESQIRELTNMLSEANDKIDKISAAPEQITIPYKETAEVELSDIEGLQCITGKIVRVNDIVETKVEEENNIKIIVFPDGDNGFFTDQDSNVISVTAINGIIIDDIVVETIPVVPVPVGAKQR